MRGYLFALRALTLDEPTNDLDMETLDLLLEMQVIDEQKLMDKLSIPALARG